MNAVLGWFLQTSVLALAVALFVVLTATCEAGYRLGRWRARKVGDDKAHAATATLAAAMLGLMTFMLGLSINSAQNRFEARRELVVTEANAIGTAWLRGRMVGGPDGAAITGLIDDYAKTRLAFTLARSEPLAETLNARGEAQQNQFWARARVVARASPTAVSATLISALNHMFDSSLSQRFAFISEPPSGMIDAMILGSIIAVGAMGFEMGLESGRQWVLSSLLMLMWAGVMLMTMDLGRARLGAVRVDVRPLEWTIHGFETAPAPPPEPGPPLR